MTWVTWCGASRRRRVDVPAQFNLIDALLALVILLGMFAGWRRGFVLETLGLAVLAASLLIAFWAYPYPAREFERHAVFSGEWVAPVAFIGIFITARILLGVLANALAAAVPPVAHRHRANRVLGIVPGFVDGVVHAMLAALLLLALPWPETIAAQTRESAVVTRLAEPAQWLVSELTPIFEPVVSKTMKRMVVKPGSRDSLPLGFTVPDPQPRPDLEARMLQLVNQERKARGLGALRADPELTQVARAHSRDMLVRGYFSHVSPEGKDPFDRIRQANVKYLTAGENLAFATTLSQAHKGLMDSPGHRANILRPAFGRVGIGIMDGGRRGQMVTQEFRN
jgi:uncharacterized protein YkwD